MKNINKVLALVLVVLVAITCVPTTVVKAVEFDTDTDGYKLIKTPEQLKALMDDAGKITGNYRLANDIDMTGITGQSPIGTDSINYFSGTFDGNGYAIKGLNISDSQRAGLFGYAHLSSIKDLTVYGNIVNSSTATSNAFNLYAAGIVAGGQGLTVSGCTNYCSITGNGICAGIVGLSHASKGNVKIENCVNYGTVKSRLAHNAGIVGALRNGDNVSTTVDITGCVNYGLIDGSSISQLSGGQMVCGGIVGYSYCAPAVVTVKNCTNYGDVVVRTINLSNTTGGGSEAGVGGIVGRIAAKTKPSSPTGFSVNGCLNMGNITADYYGGGIIGYIAEKATTDVESVISNCVNVGDITAFRYAAGIVAYAVDEDECNVLKVNNCVNLGTTTAKNTKADESCSAGIVGGCDGAIVDSCVDYGAQVCNAKSATRVSGIVGYGIAGKAVKCYTTNNSEGEVKDFVLFSTCKKIDDAALKSADTFAALDLETTWKMTADGPMLRNVGAKTLNVTNGELGRGLALRDDGNGSFSIRKTYSITVQEVDDTTAPVVEFGVLFKSAANDTPFAYFNGGMYYGAELLDVNGNHENGIGKSVCYVRDSANNDAAAVKRYNWDGNSSDVTYTGVLSELNDVNLLTMAFTVADYKVTGIDAQTPYIGAETTFSAQDIARIILADADLSDPAELTGDELVAYKVLSAINPYTFAPVE